MNKPIHAAILGASGYGAGELLRLLVQHPYVAVVAVTSTSRGRADPRGPSAFARLLRPGDCGQTRPSAISRRRTCRALLRAAARRQRRGAGRPDRGSFGNAREGDRPVGRSSPEGPQRDTSAAYPESPLLPERRAEFAYGLPELNRQRICGANRDRQPRLPGNGGRFLPPRRWPAPEFRGPLVIDAKTGSSGAGRTPKETTHHPTRHGDFRAYKPLAHQHEPEILQALGDPLGQRIELSFVPQSMAVLARHLRDGVCDAGGTGRCAARSLRRYEEFYAGSPFVRVAPGSPTLEDVVGSNFCDLGVAARGRQVVAMSAIDNLVKGMAGTAIQNMNLMCGLPETTGLWTPSLRPV